MPLSNVLLFLVRRLLPWGALFIWTFLLLDYLNVLKVGILYPYQILAVHLLASIFILVLFTLFLGFLAGVAVALMMSLFIFYAASALQEPFLVFQAALYAVVLYRLWWFQSKREENRSRKEVEIENTDEEANLFAEQIRQKEALIKALEEKLSRFLELDKFRETLKTGQRLEEICPRIVQETHTFFKQADDTFLFLLDDQKHSLGLIARHPRHSERTVKSKTGDIFDQWVMKFSQALLVEDVIRDFRFNIDHLKTLDYMPKALAAVPLITEKRALGILRVNASKAGSVNADDLRLLDIIGDLSAVTIRNVLLYEKTQELAIHDGLTQLYLFRYFQERLSEEIYRASRSHSPLSLVLMDIDFFKTYNDRYGHAAGDLVLRTIAHLLMKSVKAGEIAARYGGEEFVIALPQRSKKETLAFAEEIRKEITHHPFKLQSTETQVTVSVGVATFPDEALVKEDLLRLADQRLYTAKSQGRNRVCGSA